MSAPRRSPYFTLFWLLVALLCLLAVGALIRRQEFLTRGLPKDLPEPIVEGGVRLGLNVSLEQYDDAELELNLTRIKDIGFEYVRQTFHFREAYDWGESDRIVEQATASGLVLVPLLDGDPAAYFEPPENLTMFAAWAGEFSNRYAHLLQHYIIWDEPNLTSHWGNQPVNAVEYASLLTAASKAIRAADPDAIIVAAPLAPTFETGPSNLSETMYLRQLYEAGAAEAFDVIAGKPYGFDTGPEDRVVSADTLNFSRIILLRELMVQHGDQHKAVWAGNWGWNSLPDSWRGEPSIWGETSEQQQAARTIAAIDRAQREWPWMGIMFLENWQPNARDNDPRWGFSIAGRETARAIEIHQREADDQVAMPGFHLAQLDHLPQRYAGDWRFSPDYGADIGRSGDHVSFRFWGTDIGLRVRRANYRARLYVTVDGQPANALPNDENGTMLVLTAPSPAEEFISNEWVARNLTPGVHTLEVVASRGWDQWALNGFSVRYAPSESAFQWAMAIVLTTLLLVSFLMIRTGRRAEWGTFGQSLARAYAQLDRQQQLVITAISAGTVVLAGWLTWGEQAAGIYRRLGDPGQLALTAAAASIFYVTPTFLIYIAALTLLFVLITFRPAWGVVLVAISIPFYVVPKPMLGYRFSPVEVFTLVATAAFALSRAMERLSDAKRRTTNFRLTGALTALHQADVAVLVFTFVATLSLLFTERLDVATNEWRAVILEPAIFYFLLRGARLNRREMWTVFDAFVLGGLLVAIYGLWQYGAGENLITAEGGLMRLRSIYGSPNNVGLYLGRVIPPLAAMTLAGTSLNGKRRWAYALLLLPVGLATVLSFSRGALFLGIPAALLYVFWRWQRAFGRRTWPWLMLFAGLGLVGVALALQIPILAGRFDLEGATSVFRINLWRASLNMIADHPLFGVGLDNFLYAYRGRYIFDAAWQAPGLSHPHNILLDFTSRLGVLGTLAGGWMIWMLVRSLRKAQRKPSDVWTPVVIGLGGMLADMVAHGLVDHSFFLVDLAFAFFLMLAMAVRLSDR